MQRRNFLKLAGASAAWGVSGTAWAEDLPRVSIVLAHESQPVRWAANQLQQAFSARHVNCAIVPSPDQAAGSRFSILAATPGSPLAKAFPPPAAGLATEESLRITPGRLLDMPVLFVQGGGDRGLIYALLELMEQVESSADPIAALQHVQAIEENPANLIRSVGRYFCSEIEDKPWYYDEEFWPEYLDRLIASRFNRFNLGFGLGYDFPRGVTGDYFHFVYPYMVDVPGYPSVRVVQLRSDEGKMLPQPVPLSTEERDRNLRMLRFIAAETGRRGMEFQLGIWTHAYQWVDSPEAYHRIEGLTPETHAAYCRDALAMLLRECPQIAGLTLRVHGESGIPEGSYGFWKTLFEAITGCGRRVEIDMHAKGVNQTMIDMAADTGMPVKLSAKYSAEHQSLGHHQADIRTLEIPRQKIGEGPCVSSGARSFTRYGYADFLHQGRRYDLLFRLWPGTQRHLLCCDPAMAAAYGRTSHFCGAVGLDLCEPLTFKGREGTGQRGGRCAYSDRALEPEKDWRKYEPYYRLWGRRLYSPESEPSSLRRYLRRHFGSGSAPAETALASSGRILALLTSAHLPSASNHAFWPEIYDNMPIIPGSEPSPYGDTPKPRCFATVSPLDPQLFSTIAEHADDLLNQRPNPKYSPIEVACWMEDLTSSATSALASATGQHSPAVRRIEEDVLIQIGLGTFFAHKLRSGVLYAIWDQTGDPHAGQAALDRYRQARSAWDQMARRAARVYRLDITYGDVFERRGHWIDRLAGIDTDLAAMQQKLRAPQSVTSPGTNTAAAIRAAIGHPTRPHLACAHQPPARFTPGSPLPLSLTLPHPIRQARLWYRHVDQAERWTSIAMQPGAGGFSACIPADYTQSPFPLEYYFELRDAEDAWLYPGFNATLSNQPYFAVWLRGS